MLTRFATTLLAAFVLAGVAAATTQAASLLYVDPSNNIALARPDGSDARAITHDATAANAYRSPVADDSGRIVAMRRYDDGSYFHTLIDRNGTTVSGPWLWNHGICSYIPPTQIAISPEGGLIAMLVSPGTGDCLTLNVDLGTSVVFSDNVTLRGILPHFSGMFGARFMRRGTDGLVGRRSDGSVVVQPAADQQPVTWFTLDPSVVDLNFIDPNPVADQLLLTMSDPGTPDVERLDLAVVSWSGTPGPGAPPSVVCSLRGFANGSNGIRPRWSPDGTQIAWAAPDGIYVSPAPAPTGGGEPECSLSPKLVIPGGRDVDWARFDLPATPGTTPPGGGSGGGGGSTTPGGGASGKAPAVDTRSRLSTGIALTVSCRAACRIASKATISGTLARRYGLVTSAKAARRPYVIASARASRTSAGSKKLKLRLTAKARKRLAKVARLRVTVTTTVTTRGVKKATTSRKVVTLKR